MNNQANESVKKFNAYKMAMALRKIKKSHHIVGNLKEQISTKFWDVLQQKLN